MITCQNNAHVFLYVIMSRCTHVGRAMVIAEFEWESDTNGDSSTCFLLSVVFVPLSSQ